MSDPFPGKGRLRPADEELRQLKKELKRCKAGAGHIKKKPWPFSRRKPKIEVIEFIEERRSEFVVEKMCPGNET